jgi:hypothetical protein
MPKNKIFQNLDIEKGKEIKLGEGGLLIFCHFNCVP